MPETLELLKEFNTFLHKSLNYRRNFLFLAKCIENMQGCDNKMMLTGTNKINNTKMFMILLDLPPSRDIDLLKIDLRGSRDPFQHIVVAVLVMCCVPECFQYFLLNV